MNYLQNKCNISCHLLKKFCTKNVATALPILNDKAMPNFYDNFVHC